MMQYAIYLGEHVLSWLSSFEPFGACWNADFQVASALDPSSS